MICPLMFTVPTSSHPCHRFATELFSLEACFGVEVLKFASPGKFHIRPSAERNILDNAPQWQECEKQRHSTTEGKVKNKMRPEQSAGSGGCRKYARGKATRKQAREAGGARCAAADRQVDRWLQVDRLIGRETCNR